MAIHFTTGAQPETSVSTGGDGAQATPADYRLSAIHDETVGGLRLIRSLQFGAGFMTPILGGIAINLITNFNIPTLIAAAFFLAVMFFLLRYAASECGEVLTTVNALEYMKDSQRREIDKMNIGLVRLHQRNLFLEHKLAAAGGADGDAGGKHPSPSASNIRRFIPNKGSIQ